MRFSMLAGVMVAVVMLPGGCQSDKVPKAEALQATVMLTAAKAADPAEQTAALAKGCSELTGCAGACRAGLEGYAASAPEQKAKALVDACGDARSYVHAADADGMAKQAEDFVKDRVSKYAYRAAQSLGGAERKRFDEARMAMGL